MENDFPDACGSEGAFVLFKASAVWFGVLMWFGVLIR